MAYMIEEYMEKAGKVKKSAVKIKGLREKIASDKRSMANEIVGMEKLIEETRLKIEELKRGMDKLELGDKNCLLKLAAMREEYYDLQRKILYEQTKDEFGDMNINELGFTDEDVKRERNQLCKEIESSVQ